MNPLIITGIDLAITLIQQAIAAKEITPAEVVARINAKQNAADASEKRIDDLLKKP